MDYEIIATLGPASEGEETWRAMLAAGVSAFRLNTSHLSIAQLTAWLERLDSFYRTLEQKPPLVLDLQGSKWRLGQFEPFTLADGQRIELVLGASSARQGTLPVPHSDFFKAAAISSGDIVLNDAKIRLQMETAGPDIIRGLVKQGGLISPHKGITFAASEYRSEALSEKDQAILEQTRGMQAVRYAISYVKDAAEMERYRAITTRVMGSPAYLVAKLERRPAIDQAQQIAAFADELWLCRGDLGAELGLVDMAEAVHLFSNQVRRLPVPAMMAGQVLEHLTGQPTPTRSEICYIYDTLAQGYRGFVLSDETAIGQHPLESCRAAALFRSV